MLSNNLEVIGDNTFNRCTKLKEVIIHEGVKLIGTDAFNRCFSLVKISLPKSLKSIESYAFSKCSSLKEIVMPKNVSIGKNAFNDCLPTVKKKNYLNNQN